MSWSFTGPYGSNGSARNRASSTDAGRVAELVYLLYVVVSGGVFTSSVAPLGSAAEPKYEPDGDTPIGQGLKTLADTLDAFVSNELVPNEVTVRALNIAVISDLTPSGEAEGETAAGVARFAEVMKKLRAEVQLVGPSETAMNHTLVGPLDVSGNGVTYLDSADPASLFTWTFDSIVAQSRKVTGSRSRGKVR